MLLNEGIRTYCSGIVVNYGSGSGSSSTRQIVKVLTVQVHWYIYLFNKVLEDCVEAGIPRQSVIPGTIESWTLRKKFVTYYLKENI